MTMRKALDGSMLASLPKDEPQRLEALRSYGVLDTPEEALYDDLVLIASTICQTPIAIVSLVDGTRAFLKARRGLPVAETTRDASFCSHAILETKPMFVNDAMQDPRFATNPFVRADPNIRFYAGVQLVNPEGHALGTLCVLDSKPRELNPEQRDALAALGRQTMANLELRRTVLRMKAAVEDQAAPPVSALPRESSGERARTILAQSDEMRSRIRDLLGRVEHIQRPAPGK